MVHKDNNLLLHLKNYKKNLHLTILIENCSNNIISIGINEQ